MDALAIQLTTATTRTIALVLLVALFVFALAVTPLEVRFYQEVRQRIAPALTLEIITFVLAVAMLAGVILDWYASPLGLAMLVAQLMLFLVLTLVFLFHRYRLVAVLYTRAALGSKRDLERLLARMAEAKVRAETEQGNEAAGGGPDSAEGDSPDAASGQEEER